MKTVSILGCGWLGFPLAKSLVDEGYKVNGAVRSSTRKQEFQQSGINFYQLNLLSDTQRSAEWDAFLSAEVLVIAIPPGTRSNPPGTHVQQIQRLIAILQEQSAVKQVIYISSTSVYPDDIVFANESVLVSAASTGHIDLWKAEQDLLQQRRYKVTILRMAGLTGADRLLVKHFAGKTGLLNGTAPVNLVHQEDAVRAVLQVIRQADAQGIYNICAPIHPTRSAFYGYLAEKYSLPSPEFDGPDQGGKEVVATLFMKDTGFHYLFDNPLDFTYSTAILT